MMEVSHYMRSCTLAVNSMSPDRITGIKEATLKEEHCELKMVFFIELMRAETNSNYSQHFMQFSSIYG